MDGLFEAVYTTWINDPKSLLKTFTSTMLHEFFEVINKSSCFDTFRFIV